MSSAMQNEQMNREWSSLQEIWKGFGVPWAEDMYLVPLWPHWIAGRQSYGIVISGIDSTGEATPVNGFEDLGTAVFATKILRAAKMSATLIIAARVVEHPYGSGEPWAHE